jgi:hypothetical protein
MTKTLIAVLPEDSHIHLFEKFTKQFKKIKGKFDLVFFLTKKNYKYALELEKTKLKQIKEKESFENENEEKANTRNTARTYMIENNYDNILFLDSDILLKEDTLTKLLSREKEIITAAYLNILNYQGQQILAPPIYVLVEKEFLSLLKPEALEKSEMLEIGAAGLSCCLINKKVMERLTFRNPDKERSETTAFFYDAIQKLGYKAWADTEIKCIRQPYPEGDERNSLFLL